MKTTEYRSVWEERKAEERTKRNLAIEKAKMVAKILREKYEVKGVILFGSLIWRPDFLWRGTDIDLMVEGLDDERYFEALGEISSISFPFKIDLVPLEKAWPSMKKRALEEGRKLD